MGESRNQILDASGIQRAVNRIAHEILERNKGAEGLVLLGIHSGGNLLAARLRQLIMEAEGGTVPLGRVDTAMYRDDAASRGNLVVGKSTIPFPITDKQVVLVDDVLFTGRTIRAAINAVFEFGRPRNVQVAVLVDRGHRELPIRPDYVGRNLPTSRKERIEVTYGDSDVPDSVYLIKQTVAEEGL